MFDSSFFWWMLFIFWLIAMGIGQAVEQTTKVVKKVAENETVQEAGKGILGAWLESLRKK